MATTSEQDGLPEVSLAPVIAIHGVGNHAAGEIRKTLLGRFHRAHITADIEEFNWDRFVTHSIRQNPSAETLLDVTASAISNAAGLPYPGSGRGSDRILFILEQGLYHGVFRFVVAIGLAVLIIGPLLQILVLLPSAIFTGAVTRPLKWVYGLLVIMHVGLFLMVGLLTLASLRSLVNLSLAPVCVCIRRIVLLVAQPVLLLLTVPLSGEFGDKLVQFIVASIPVVFLMSMLSLVLSPLAGAATDAFSSFGMTAAFTAGLLVVAALHTGLRRLWVGALLKVVLDITCYMGSPGYRLTLLTELEKRIADIGSARPGDGMVLYAHSLGSVIALDSLLNSKAWHSGQEVQFITLGSPIMRSFIRFFPGYLFPASTQLAAKAVASRLRRFCWINIHRPWDYIGTGLGLESTHVGVDICTRQWTKLASAHSNYWNDDVVVNALRDSLRRVVPVQQNGASGPEPALVIPEPYPNQLQSRVARLVQQGAFVAILLAISIGGFAFIKSRAAWVQSIDQELLETRQHGLRSTASVTYHRTTEGSGEHQTYVHHFVFRLPDPHGELPPIAIEDNVVFDGNARRFDYKALAKDVLAGGTRPVEKPWWQILRSRKSVPCTKSGIAVWFKPDKPTSFLLPDFPATKTFLTGISEWIGSAILAVILTTVCSLIVMFAGIPLLRLFLGLSARATR